MVHFKSQLQVVCITTFLFSIFASHSFAGVYSVDQKWKFQPELHELKKAEALGQFSQCISLSKKQNLMPKSIQGWLALTWARCLQGQFDRKSFTELVKLAEKRNILLDTFPGKKDLQEALFDVALTNNIFVGRIEKLDGYHYRFLSPSLKTRLKATLLESEPSRNSFVFPVTKKNSDSFYNLEKKVSLRSCRSENSLTKYVECLKEIENTAFFSADFQKQKSQMIEHVVDYLVKEGKISASASSLKSLSYFKPFELMRFLYRKAQWDLISEPSIDFWESLTSEDFLFLAKALDFAGLRQRSEEALEKLLAKKPEGAEKVEALFRMGLYKYQAAKFDESLKYWESALNMGGSSYESPLRYFQIQSLIQLKRLDDVQKLKQAYLNKFRWTYYGILLDADLKDRPGVVSSHKNEKPTRIVVASDQEQSLERVRLLSEGLWIKEAQSELNEIEWIAADSKALVPQQLASWGLYAPAIKLHSEIYDSDFSSLGLTDISFLYPEIEIDLIKEQSEKVGLPKELILSLIRQESAYNPWATSTSQAMGLMQLIPPTAQEVMRELKIKSNKATDAYRPEINLRLGSKYISDMIRKQGGSIPLGLAAYNMGPTRLNKWKEKHPEVLNMEDPAWIELLPYNESIFYVKSILRNLWIYYAIQGVDLGHQPGFWLGAIQKKEMNQ